MFGRLLNDKRFRHSAFVAETPVDGLGDEARNVAALRVLAADRGGSEESRTAAPASRMRAGQPGQRQR
jgi:hypothetical protein